MTEDIPALLYGAECLAVAARQTGLAEEIGKAHASARESPGRDHGSRYVARIRAVRKQGLCGVARLFRLGPPVYELRNLVGEGLLGPVDLRVFCIAPILEKFIRK
jgi:hypothetical protein